VLEGSGGATNWARFEVFLHDCMYSRLGIAPEEHPLMMTKVALAPRAAEEKTCQIVFETFNMPAFYLSPSPLLAFGALSLPAGVVLEVGARAAVAGVVVTDSDGQWKPQYLLPHTVRQDMDHAGACLALRMQQLLHQRGVTDIDSCTARNIVEQVCYVAQDVEEELRRPRAEIERVVTLPDGRTVAIDQERFLCPEVLFDTRLLVGAHHHTDVARLVVAAAGSFEGGSLQSPLLENVVIAGGCTTLPGFAERLERDLAAMCPRARVHAHPDRRILAWKGASQLAANPHFQQHWISKEEYDESGPCIIRPRRPF
jgi:actin-related protein